MVRPRPELGFPSLEKWRRRLVHYPKKHCNLVVLQTKADSWTVNPTLYIRFYYDVIRHFLLRLG